MGALTSLIVGLVWQFIQGEFIHFTGMIDMLLNIVQYILCGCILSVYAQMIFFSYLILHYIASALFKRGWVYIQLLCTLITLLDIVFLRVLLHHNDIFGGQGIKNTDLLLGCLVLLIAYIVTYYKVKATNETALIPTLFFMIVITIVETLFAFHIGSAALWLVYITVVVCNSYQILMLHRLLGTTATS